MHATALSLLLAGSFLAQTASQDALPAPEAGITRAELEHHVRFLASDALGGREPLTPGSERAAEYLARALAAAGCEPAGENGTFFQDTGLRRLTYPQKPVLRFQRDDGVLVEAQHGVDFTLRPRGHARSTGMLPIAVFYDYNHARMPLAGQPGQALWFSASKSDKKRILDEKGIVTLTDWGLEFEILPGDKGRTPGEAKELSARVAGSTGEEGCELVELRGALLEDFERRRFTHVELVVEELEAPFVDRNVVARLPGAGLPGKPELADEVVLFSAHYDHLGTREAKRETKKERTDDIFNGADDDASGCAALLELAQALAAGPRPARTLVFLFATGEESGGHGSARYLAAPPYPVAKTVANLNLEMLGRPDPEIGGAGRLWLTGFERSNVGPLLVDQALPVVADPRLEQRFFQRSDNYAFALEGVVAQTLSSFALHEEYHTVRDEADTLDFAHLEAAARVALEAARLLSDGKFMPAWLEGKRPQRFTGTLPTEPKSDEEKAAERERIKAERQKAREKKAGAGAGGDDEPK